MEKRRMYEKRSGVSVKLNERRKEKINNKKTAYPVGSEGRKRQEKRRVWTNLRVEEHKKPKAGNLKL
jgi:hypothetical protein